MLKNVKHPRQRQRSNYLEAHGCLDFQSNADYALKLDSIYERKDVILEMHLVLVKENGL